MILKQDEQVENMNQKNIKCWICKDLGHVANDCDRDPNFRTSKDVESEYERLVSFKNHKNLHTESQVVTF